MYGDGGWYKLGCSSGILNINYQAADLEIVDAVYRELDNIPETVVSLTVAVRVQGTGDESSASTSRCHCKNKCSTKRCPCKSIYNSCNPSCHPIVLILIVCNLQT